MNDIKLMTNSSIKTEDGREFTRLMGGFDEDKPIISDIQIAELLGYKNGARQVRQQIERNSKYFEYGVHINDLKIVVAESDNNSNTLQLLGYSKMAIAKSQNIYILSQAGFLLYLKFAEGDNAVEVYKNFIEDYFQTKAENITLKKTIDEEIEELKKQKAFFIGMGAMESDPAKQIELFREMENVNLRIIKLEKTLTQKQTVEELQPQLHIAETVGNIKGYYDMGNFAKILGVEKLGRNNMFKWLRENKLLMQDNNPYQNYMKYFKVIPVVSSNGFKSSKTMLKPNGIEYVVKRLIKDGKIITRDVDAIIDELESIA